MAQIWSSLPIDIRRLVMKRISYKDHLRFRAVCKNWRDVADGANDYSNVNKKAEKLPWIMAYGSSSCFLYEPSHKRQYTVFSNDKGREEIFADALALDSKNDWVLFSQWTTSSFFFYNPFTDSIIQLPKLDLTNSKWVFEKVENEFKLRARITHVGHRATFSTSPVSSDCVIFLAREKSDCSDFSIWLCKPGDTKWTEHLVKRDYGDFVVEDVEYMNGVFYSSFGEHGIGTFNVALNEWKLHPYPCPLHEKAADVYRCRDRLTECNGYLLLSHQLVFLSTPQTSWWNFLRLDESEMNWVQVESWDNRSLFLGIASMFIPVQDQELANTMHLLTNVPYVHGRYFRPHVSQLYIWNITGFTKLWIQPPSKS